ncbi:molybdopterin-guanine dinucleotide biosynthesis protein B [Alcaligenaceae bacterium]|nr:molybdopterin-guanine dinucleotide biosynthesis protein B [Alcaligenaceae bacterium]
MTKRVLGVVGRSGNGKTTLLEYLLPHLVAQGLRVNIIKHSHHDIQLEPAHKDSARLRTAGAAEVLVASPYRVSLVQELRDQAEPSLSEQLARLSPADLTLVEGYKQIAMPKIEVYRPEVGKQPLYPHDEHILAVASDASAPPMDRSLDWLDLRQPQQILNWIMAYATK